MPGPDTGSAPGALCGHGPKPTPLLAGLLAGARLPLEGLRLLRGERQLWLPALVPFLLSLAAFSTAVALVVAYAGELHGWATAWMPALRATRWYTWLWIGPSTLALKALGALLFLALAGAAVVASYLVANLLASPFHEALSRRVELIVTGGVVDQEESGLRGALRAAGGAARQELRRLLFVALVATPLMLAGLVPGLQVVTGPALVGLAVYLLPLEYAAAALDRRQLSFAERRRWLAIHRGPTLGFGGAAFAVCTLPVVNLLALPVLVVAGTLLVLRQPPASSR